MLELQLKPGLVNGRRARLRELCGHDESLVRGTSSAVAVTLLDRLLVVGPGDTVPPGSAGDLAICDRDRLLAAVYRATFGDRIDTQGSCVHCGQPFDLQFSLAALQDSLEGEDLAEGPDKSGHYRLPDGRVFRLPTWRDEHAIAGLEPAVARRTLAARCLVSGDPDADPAPLLAALERQAPVLDLELGARCPHCERDGAVHFDLQSFLLAALEREGQWLVREVHRIAVAYHWSHKEILDLPRSQRQLHVSLIEADMAARRRPA
jgi:hypothetical protein